MEETLVGILFLVLALLGTPLFVIFGGAAAYLFSSLADTSITGAANDVFSEKFADSPLLVTIPLFTFAGYLMAESGTPKRLVELSRAWLGWLPGGLPIVCLLASAFFTTFTGGSGITIVAIGGLLYPALRSDGYGEKFSLGLITTGGSLGLLFPPSLPIVLYGVVAGVMIEKLFLAGIIPGVLSVAALAGYAFVIDIRRRDEIDWAPVIRMLGATVIVTIAMVCWGMWLNTGVIWHSVAITLVCLAGWFGALISVLPDRQEAFQRFKHTIFEVMLPVVLLTLMALGALRIHEAAAFTAIYVLIIEVFIYKDISIRKDLPRVVRESMTLVGAILIILATAIGFTAFLIQAQVPMKILAAMQQTISSDLMFLLVLNVFLLVVGMLMDIFSAIVVVVPLIIPIARSFGVDPYHLGIVFLLNLEIGYMTPPVGLNLFISSFRFGKPVTILYRAVIPFIVLLVACLLLTTYVPKLSTGMAGLMDDGGEVEADEPTGEESGGSLDDLETESGGGTLDDLEGEDDDGELNLDDLEDEDDEGSLDDLEKSDDEISLDDLEDDTPEDEDVGEEEDIDLDDL